MADAQLPLGDDARTALLRSDETFRELVSEHHALDELIQQFAALSYPTEQQQLDEIALKKRKLALKDRIEAVVRGRQAAPSDTMRPH